MIFPSTIHMPQKTVYERGAHMRLAKETQRFGMNGLIVHGKSLVSHSVYPELKKSFKDLNVYWYPHTSGEPTINDLSHVIDIAHKHGANWIIGIGGGSVLDVAKAAAGLFNAECEPTYYQEGHVLEKSGIPFVAVPTTAGTGSEVTCNSVIINPVKGVKLSIRDESFLARTVVLDPLLMRGIPKQALTYAGLDALVQGYEAYTSKNATWYSDMYALKGFELVSRHLLRAYDEEGIDEYEKLLLGSYFIGIAFSSARLGVIHGIAHPLGVLYHQPHGLICAVCLPASISLNRAAVKGKYDVLSEVVEKDFATYVDALLEALGIVSPFRGKKVIQENDIIDATLHSGSTAAGPKPITREDVCFILREIF